MVGAIDESGHRTVLTGIAWIAEEESHTMAEELRIALKSLPRKARMEEGADVLRDG